MLVWGFNRAPKDMGSLFDRIDRPINCQLPLIGIEAIQVLQLIHLLQKSEILEEVSSTTKIK
ncbi:MAG: hypothetical protein BTN85_1555 [Candidatus Methanohalarchaeum thermophilum]|uniref:Uncharacterized protein n=1 Tax=Methanohalarchaeum thermophilum TaxID=1903181 RepID=A0A1Q6DXE9_METT1|nr:MAG: hypothetical protein BTN85_1555 [Candidatus Methanohalarchaeum thermophilum]